jgi:hypothetical protein
MNIAATYTRDVILSSLDTTLNGTSPVEVKLKMAGSFMSPNISFDIIIPNLNNDQAYMLVSKLSFIRNDEQEFNRQVFSLLLLGQFAPVGGFFGDNAGAGVTSSVSEFLSNQLNNLIGSTLRTDNINIQLQTAQDVVRVALRLSLLNDRLIIERNGTLVSGANQDLSLGNITISLTLLPLPNKPLGNRGILALKIFNRENLTPEQIITFNRGVGVSYKRDFDRIKDFLRPSQLTAPAPER